MITTFVLGGYSLASSFVFFRYLQRFIQDSSTANSDRGSWIVLILASVLWPISLPLSALERNVKQTKSSFYSDQSQVNLIYLERELHNYPKLIIEEVEQEKVEV